MAMNMLIAQKILKDWNIRYYNPTDREDIWNWFDEKYPGGVVKLMNIRKE